jgi:hypothetical protein
MHFIRSVCFFFSVFFPLYFGAQTTAPKLGKFLVSGEVNLPISSGNPLFKTWVQGLGGAGASARYRFQEQWVLGLGVQYSYFIINEFRVPEKIRGNAQFLSGYLEFGYEKNHNAVFSSSFTMRTGYSQIFFASSEFKKKEIKNSAVEAFFIQPTMSLALMADEISSFRFSLGLAFQGFAMNPSRIAAVSTGGFALKDYRRNTNYVFIGLGYTHYFGKP